MQIGTVGRESPISTSPPNCWLLNGLATFNSQINMVSINVVMKITLIPLTYFLNW